MKQIGIILMILLSSLLASAQDANNEKDKQKSDQISAIEKRQAQELAQLTKQLTLTKEQQASIATLQNKLNTAEKNYKESTKDDPERKMKKQEMKKLRQSYEEDVIAVFTKKQKSKYNAILKAKEQQMHSLIPQNQSRELVDNDEFPPMSQPPR